MAQIALGYLGRSISSEIPIRSHVSESETTKLCQGMDRETAGDAGLCGKG